jgi:hypothetical protein
MGWYVSIGTEKAVWQTGKGIDPLFEYSCLCLQDNPIVGHLNILLYDWKREVTKGVNRSCKSNIPKGYTEAVNQSRTDNALAKRTNNDLQNTTQKTKD